MATTGRKFAQRTHDKLMRRVLDARTRAMLQLLNPSLPSPTTTPLPPPALRFTRAV